jgi:hypothetical protein
MNRREYNFPLTREMLVDGQLIQVVGTSVEGRIARLAQIEESPKGVFTIRRVPTVDSCKIGDIIFTDKAE